MDATTQELLNQSQGFHFLTIMLSVASTLILIFLSVIGYFLKDYGKKFTELTTNVNKILTHQAAFGAACDINHKDIEKTLLQHDNSINELTKNQSKIITDVELLKYKIA